MGMGVENRADQTSKRAVVFNHEKTKPDIGQSHRQSTPDPGRAAILETVNTFQSRKLHTRNRSNLKGHNRHSAVVIRQSGERLSFAQLLGSRLLTQPNAL